MVNAQVFGGTCGASWASYDPHTSSWRTSQTSLFGDSIEFSDRFPKSGMMRNGVLYPLTMSEHPTSANASGLWPTPAAQNAGWKYVEVVDKDGNPPAHFHQRFYNKQTGQIMQRGLEQAVQWPTPLAQEAKHGTVTDWEMETDHTGTKESLRVKVAKAEQTQWRTPHAHCWKNASTMEERKGKTLNLQDQVRNWPTPTAMTGGEQVAPSHVDGTHGWNIGAAIQDSMSQSPQKNWPTPSARDWKDTPGMSPTATNPDGSHRDRTDRLPMRVFTSEPDGTTQGGSLNPTWVEWLMGYPSEWTVLEE